MVLCYMFHISVFWSNLFFEPGCYLISRIQWWTKHNKGCVWSRSWFKRFKNIRSWCKSDQGKFCFSGCTTVFSKPEYILVWGTVLFWSAKIPRRNYYSASSKCISFADSANHFQLYIKLLYLSNTIKFQRLEEPAEVGITTGTFWGLSILVFAQLFCICLRLICDMMVACFSIPIRTNLNVHIEGPNLAHYFYTFLPVKILCGCLWILREWAGLGL